MAKIGRLSTKSFPSLQRNVRYDLGEKAEVRIWIKICDVCNSDAPYAVCVIPSTSENMESWQNISYRNNKNGFTINISCTGNLPVKFFINKKESRSIRFAHRAYVKAMNEAFVNFFPEEILAYPHTQRRRNSFGGGNRVLIFQIYQKNSSEKSFPKSLQHVLWWFTSPGRFGKTCRSLPPLGTSRLANTATLLFRDCLVLRFVHLFWELVEIIRIGFKAKKETPPFPTKRDMCLANWMGCCRFCYDGHKKGYKNSSCHLFCKNKFYGSTEW